MVVVVVEAVVAVVLLSFVGFGAEEVNSLDGTGIVFVVVVVMMGTGEGGWVEELEDSLNSSELTLAKYST